MPLPKSLQILLAIVAGFLFSFAAYPLFVSWVAYYGHRWLKGNNQ